MREIDRCERDVVFFADEAGSWQVGVLWDRVLPAWFRSMSPTTEAYRFVSSMGRSGEKVLVQRAVSW